MDGTNRTVIVEEKISKPTGLTLDYINDHIYWTNDGKYIAFANLDGTNRQTCMCWCCLSYVQRGLCNNSCN